METRNRRTMDNAPPTRRTPGRSVQWSVNQSHQPIVKEPGDKLNRADVTNVGNGVDSTPKANDRAH